MAKHQEQGRVGLEEEIRTSRRTKFPKDNIMLCAPFFFVVPCTRVQALWLNRSIQSIEAKYKFEQEYRSKIVLDKDKHKK